MSRLNEYLIPARPKGALVYYPPLPQHCAKPPETVKLLYMIELNEQRSASDYCEFRSESAPFLGRIPGPVSKTSKFPILIHVIIFRT